MSISIYELWRVRKDDERRENQPQQITVVFLTVEIRNKGSANAYPVSSGGARSANCHGRLVLLRSCENFSIASSY